jgi:hypothetical protein
MRLAFIESLRPRGRDQEEAQAKRRHFMSTMFFDGNPQHEGRDHNAYPLPYVEYDATTGAQKVAEISTENTMQLSLAFLAVSTVELDLFTGLAAARLRLQASAP